MCKLNLSAVLLLVMDGRLSDYRGCELWFVDVDCLGLTPSVGACFADRRIVLGVSLYNSHTCVGKSSIGRRRNLCGCRSLKKFTALVAGPVGLVGTKGLAIGAEVRGK